MAAPASKAGRGKERNGRGERIRTSDSCVPNAVLYQTELHPDEAAATDKSTSLLQRRDEPPPSQRSRSIAKSSKSNKESLNTDGGRRRTAVAARANSSLARLRT